MIPNILLNKGGYYINEFWFSDAYQSLTKTSRDLLQCFYTELEKEYIKIPSKRKKEWVIKNNGSISFTEIQYKKLTGRCSQNYLDSRNQLIKTGIIQQTYRGGNGKGDMAKYKLLFVKGVSSDQQRWKSYPKKDWSHKIPTIRKQSIGNRTQWRKGESGKS